MNRRTEHSPVKHATVIGCGMIGPDIATVLLTHGIAVTLMGMDENDLEAGREAVQRDISELQAAGIVSEDQAGRAIESLSSTTDYAEGVRDAEIVFEAVLEDVAIKQSIFQKLDRHARSDALLCSSTSGLSPHDIAEPLRDPSRMAVTHFWNPPYLVPLVEIVPHRALAPEARETIGTFLTELGKVPVFLKKDIAGHIGNRLQHALYREALYLIEEGVASPDDIDRVVLNSFGPRFSAVGPMEYFDSCGLDLHQKVQGYLYPTLCNAPEPQKILLDNIEAGNLGTKSGRGLYAWSSSGSDEFRSRRNSRFIQKLKQPSGTEPTDTNPTGAEPSGTNAKAAEPEGPNSEASNPEGPTPEATATNPAGTGQPTP